MTDVQGALDALLLDLSAAIAARDEALAHLHEADAALRDGIAERDELRQGRLELEERLRAVQLDLAAAIAARDQAEKGRVEFEERLRVTQSEKAALLARAETAERLALQQANAALETTKQEIQRLSGEIDAIQSGRVWRVKRMIAKLRGLLVR